MHDPTARLHQLNPWPSWCWDYGRGEEPVSAGPAGHSAVPGPGAHRITSSHRCGGQGLGRFLREVLCSVVCPPPAMWPESEPTPATAMTGQVHVTVAVLFS